MLPEPLARAIDRLTADVPLTTLRRAAATLSECYRGGSPRGLDASERLAYIAVRLPATYAAIAHVLATIKHAQPKLAPASLLDLGSGPGTALWAAREIFGPLPHATLVERDPGFAALGRHLLTEAPCPTRVTWSGLDLATPWTLGGHDLVIAAFSLGELGSRLVDAVDAAWSATRGVLVVIEPGTPAGFAAVLLARARLVALGARVLAPCPHETECPVAPLDLCHFAVRLARTRTHRLAKGAVRGYEDEKFSYVVAGRRGSPASARVVRRPEARKGHVHLRLCTTSGVVDRTVSRREPERYRAARRTGWGDAWDEAASSLGNGPSAPLDGGQNHVDADQAGRGPEGDGG